MTVQAARVVSGDIDLLERRTRETSLTVLSAFEHAVNLLTPTGAMWTVASRTVSNGPGTLVIDHENVHALNLDAGDQVQVVGPVLTLASGRVLSTRGAQRWNPPRRVPPPRSHNVELARATLTFHGCPGGLLAGESAGFAAATGPVLRQRFAELQHAAAADDEQRVRSLVAGIVGLGVGLTPAGDDALAGLIVTLTLVPGPARRTLQVLAATALAQPTTAVSHAMLAAAARGRAVDPVHVLLQALAAEDAAAVERATRAVIAHGHTSGTDLMCGLLAALDLHEEMRGTA